MGNGFRGFNLDNSSSKILEENTAENNSNYSFEVLATSLLNTFTENEGCGTGIMDALDATFGTVNVWEDNDFCISGCPAPPVSSSVTPSEIPAPDTGGEFFDGRFEIVGRNFQGGDVFVNGPLVVEADPQINFSATIIEKDFSIGCCVPRDFFIRTTFDVIVSTACGVATSPVLVVAEFDLDNDDDDDDD